MLYSAKQSANHYAGQGRMWQRPYAETQPRAASALASAWFTAYPAAIITRENESVLRTLGDAVAAGWHGQPSVQPMPVVLPLLSIVIV